MSGPPVAPLSREVCDGRSGVSESNLERLYRTEGAKLWRAVMLYAGDREVANDSVAEAFAQALRRGSDVRRADRWVWRAAFRIAAGELKDRRRRFGVAWTAEPLDDAPEQAMDLLNALRTLSPKQRASAILHHYAGYSVREIAVIVGSTPAAVGVHLSRARARLRHELEVADD